MIRMKRSVEPAFSEETIFERSWPVVRSAFLLSNNMDVDVQHREHGDSSKSPKPHEFLWFPDGNVILTTDLYLFKVHKSLLSLHSSVFKHMFELPNVGSSTAGENSAGVAQEMYDGLPLVTLVGDKGEDVVHLLRTVYELRCVL